ncbi:MAG: tyrosinase family protein, partial [Solirubrobacterales bacterium]|nr:tyrosinase family protein [Solirubrobacterales bacterium]
MPDAGHPLQESGITFLGGKLMTVASRTLAREAVKTLKHRKSVAKLTVKQVVDLRRAFEAVLPINDERGYNYHAGIHGLPLPMYCEHGTLLFLPWHRAYLYFFELALRDRVKTVSLPWWNWASAGSRRNGIPKTYAAQSVDGTANPLFSAPIPPVARVSGRPRESFRRPRDPSLLPTQQDVQDVLDEPDFRGFSDKVEVLHNGVHVWIGGTTAQVPWAAYDPLFWTH